MHVDAMLRSGRPREVLAQAHALVRAAPLRERRWELLVLAQYQTGAQGEALRSLRQLRAVLARELGIDPSPEMLALEQSILNQDPRLLVPQQRAGAAQCPWQGLKAYDVDDTERFFGRDADVDGVPGDPGPGLVRRTRGAVRLRQVLPPPRRRAGVPAPARPPGRPRDAGAAARCSRSPRWTRTHRPAPSSPWTRARRCSPCATTWRRGRTFLERLAEESRRRPVLVTVRGDRLGQVTEHAGFSRLVEGGLHLVGALDEHGLRQAIERPAEQAGLVIEHGLVDVLVHEVRDDPGALPLLSHALLETWQRREGNTLTVDGYRASGGIHGAVAQSAEQLYGRIEPEQRRQLRDLVLRLVSPGAEGEAVRSRVPRRLVAPAHDRARRGPGRRSPGDQRRRTSSRSPTRRWPGPGPDCVAGSTTTSRANGSGTTSAARPTPGTPSGRPASELYRGVRLTRVLDWQSRTEPTLTETEREFLDAAREASDAEERSAAEHARAQARLIRRLRIVLGGAAVLLVLALAAGGIAAVQSDRARRATPPGRNRRLSPQTRGGSEPAPSSPTTSASRCCSRPRARAWTTRRRPGSTW